MCFTFCKLADLFLMLWPSWLSRLAGLSPFPISQDIGKRVVELKEDEEDCPCPQGVLPERGSKRRPT